MILGLVEQGVRPLVLAETGEGVGLEDELLLLGKGDVADPYLLLLQGPGRGRGLVASGEGLGHAVEEHVPGPEDRGEGHPLPEIKFLQVGVVLQSLLADVLKLIPETLLHYFIIDRQR